MLYKPLFLLCYLFWAVSQQEHIHKGGKKKASQQDDSAEGTSQQSRKPRHIIFGAVSCFLETHSTFLSHLLNNLQLGICTKHFIFFLIIFFFPPEAAITEQAEAGEPAGADEDPAAAGLITARQIKNKKRGCLGRWQRLTGCTLFFPSLRHDLTKRLAGCKEACCP